MVAGRYCTTCSHLILVGAHGRRHRGTLVIDTPMAHDIFFYIIYFIHYIDNKKKINVKITNNVVLKVHKNVFCSRIRN